MPRSEAFAASKGAALASARSALGKYSLSPASLESISRHTALVLPSPNGSALSLLAGTVVPTFTACFRNCAALAARLARYGPRIAVIPAGEQWSDGSLRPAMEDLTGAGAVLALLPGRLSPEAELAVAAFERFRANLHDALARSISGRELVEEVLPAISSWLRRTDRAPRSRFCGGIASSTTEPKLNCPYCRYNTRMPDALSLCMIVKNEERNLPRCLDSVRDLAGELHRCRHRFDRRDAQHRGPLRGAK